MSKDPAFLFYDGDAARDVSHMNRLERGAYFDFIQAQRKFGDLTLCQIQKILGKDFDSCWPAIELIAEKKDSAYYLDWVKTSISRRKHHCDQQRQRVTKRWAAYRGNTTVIPRIYLKENENENEKKGGVGENKKQVLLKDREEIFRMAVFDQKGYPHEMYLEFFNYWSEADRLGKKMRFEDQKTWDLKKRLANWYARSNKNYGNGKRTTRPIHEYEREAATKYDAVPQTPIGGPV